MACTGAANVFAISVPGTFDDAQRVLKETFGDAEFAALVHAIKLLEVFGSQGLHLRRHGGLCVSRNLREVGGRDEPGRRQQRARLRRVDRGDGGGDD